MLAQLVGAAASRRASRRWTPSSRLGSPSFDADGIRVVCLSYMNEDSAAHARYMGSAGSPEAAIAAVLVGFWMATPNDEARGRTLERIKADFFATSLREALEQVRDHAQSAERDEAEAMARPRASRSGRA